MDFGIAKLGSTNVTRSGMMVGTLNYMSPEQIRGQPLDGRSDVFSVGVIFYQLLNGKRPFVGTGGPDVLYKIVQAPTPPLGVDLGPETKRLEEIVSKALEKDVQARYGSAAELADDIERVLEVRNDRVRPPALAQGDQETLTAARRALKEGRIDEAQRRLEPLLAKSPDALEARRLMRVIRRERQDRSQASEAAADAFPELEATYRAHVTQRTPDTFVGETQEQKAAVAPGAPAGTPAWLLPVAGTLLVAAVVAGVLLTSGGSKPDPKSSPTTTSSQPASPQPQQSTSPSPVRSVPASKPPALLKLAVESDPAGASLTLDGVRVGQTPAEISVDATADRKLVVALDGYAPQEVKLPAGRIPPSLSLTLEPSGPPGTFAVVSSYPVDVAWKGKPLARAQVSPRVSLPPGRHSLQVTSSSHFLRREVTVEIKSGGSAGFEAPALGKIHIKANPDNCEVFIDGVFVDYPPILDRAIAEGAHTVSFKWPDGLKRDEAIQVSKGQPSFVTGRRE